MGASSVHLVDTAFERALEEILARVFSSTARAAIAVAYSGGLDSSVLLHLTRSYAAPRGLRLHAFHVHHGLSPNADDWARHCEQAALSLDVPFAARHVQVDAVDSGIEQAARTARYAALGALCAEHGVSLLLTAHHQDDQAETVLLQLLRGAGVAGLAAMENLSTAPGLLGQADTPIGRPMLQLARADIRDRAAVGGWNWIEDESNADVRHARNRLRHDVLPQLQAGFPGFQQRLARSAMHAAAAQQLLDEMAAEDLQRCRAGEGLDLDRLRTLGSARRNNLLRHWFALRDVRMPSTAWLQQMQNQVFAAADDAQVRITHPDCEIWRYRGRLLLVSRVPETLLHAGPREFEWQGEAALSFADFGGRLLFEPGKEGIDRDWLRTQPLRLAHRTGGERLKPAPNRHTRDLKHHYQSLGVPPWERRRLPLVWRGQTLLYAAGVGHHCAPAIPYSSQGIVLRWERGMDGKTQ